MSKNSNKQEKEGELYDEIREAFMACNEGYEVIFVTPYDAETTFGRYYSAMASHIKKGLLVLRSEDDLIEDGLC